MEFGLQIIRSGDFSDYFKITFNIYDDNDPAAGAHRPFISHEYISEQLTDEITSKTGFDTDDDLNLYFSNSSGSGLTIVLDVDTTGRAVVTSITDGGTSWAANDTITIAATS